MTPYDPRMWSKGQEIGNDLTSAETIMGRNTYQKYKPPTFSKDFEVLRDKAMIDFGKKYSKLSDSNILKRAKEIDILKDDPDTFLKKIHSDPVFNAEVQTIDTMAFEIYKRLEALKK
jgi:hypothetical protein